MFIARRDTAANVSAMSHRRSLNTELSGDRSLPQAQFRVLSQSVRLFIIEDKLSASEVSKWYGVAESLGALRASSFKFTNLILTGLRAPKRIESALKREQGLLSDEWIRKIPVLHLEWLEQTAQLGIMQAYDDFRVLGFQPARDDPKIAQPSGTPSAPAAKRSRSPKVVSDRAEILSNTESSESEELESPSKRVKSEHEAKPSRAPPWKNSDFCCERPSPLISLHNQELVDQLEIIRKQRALTSQRWSERSYGNCLSAIKAYPRQVCSLNIKEVRELKGVGQKMIGIIEQFCSSGRIVEAQQISSDPANEILFSFMDLYGIGPVAACTLYEQGCRTFEDVIAKGKSLATQLKVDECYRILPDLKMKIARSEVEHIGRLVYFELLRIIPDAFYKICGGYRRGKAMTSDVDLVLSSCSSDFTQRHGVIDRLLQSMKRQGLMSHTVNVIKGGDGFESSRQLDIAEIVVLPPVSATIPRPRYRRVDLIFCAPEIYGAAVLGWTGSKTYEKDLRRWAQHRGYKFHSSGLVHKESGDTIETRSEADVFSKLGLVNMPPELRNCDA